MQDRHYKNVNKKIIQTQFTDILTENILHCLINDVNDIFLRKLRNTNKQSEEM
jgi:hypothetical protein